LFGDHYSTWGGIFKKYLFKLPSGFKFLGLAYKCDIQGIASHCNLLASTFCRILKGLNALKSSFWALFVLLVGEEL
jgi:hypothetical protein